MFFSSIQIGPQGPFFGPAVVKAVKAVDFYIARNSPCSPIRCQPRVRTQSKKSLAPSHHRSVTLTGMCYALKKHTHKFHGWYGFTIWFTIWFTHIWDHDGTMMWGGVSRDGSPLKKVPSKNSEKSIGSTPSDQNHQKQSGDVQGNLGGHELETGEDRWKRDFTKKGKTTATLWWTNIAMENHHF